MPQRLFTRVAVVQLAYHPAILLANRSPLEDPLGTDDALRVLDDLPGKLTERLQSLRARIRQTYLGQLRKKVVAVLDFCRRSGVRLVVFPEYAVPWQLLSDVVQASDQMVVVAGTHTVDRESRKSGIYAQLSAANPTLLSAVCPVLYRGRALALQAKLNPAKPEEGQMKPGTAWSPIELPNGLPGPMGTLVCLDFLFRESPAHQRLVLPRLTECRFLVVPSLTPTHTLGEFSAKAWEEARRYGRPVLYCDTAGLADKEGGGTSIFVDEGHPSDLRSFPEQVGYLDRGEEGVIVADVDLGYVHTGESTRYDWQRPVRPFAAANLLYGFHPADLRYRAWLNEASAALPDEEAEAVESLSQRVDAGKSVLLDAAAMGGSSRGRRLRQLVKGHDHLQSVEDFQKRLREVELPDDVLPLPVLRGAMAGAVSDVLFDWQRETRDPKLAELSERLRKASESATKDRAERSEPGTKSIGQVRESVIGTELQRPEPTPTVIRHVQQVLPPGIDPAILGVRQANGLTLRFAASVDALWMNSLRGLADDHMLPDGAAGTEGIKIVAGLRVADWFPTVGGIAGLKVRTPHPLAASPEHGATRHPVADVVAGFERTSSRHHPSKESLGFLGTLLLLARAEGCGSCAVLSIEGSDSEKPFILPRDVFVIVSVGSGWELWFAPDDGQTKSEQANYQRALEEIGFSPLRFVPVAAKDVDKRIRPLLSLFQSHPEQLRLRRDLKLREVAGHFVDLQVQVVEQRQPGLRALDSWLDGKEQTALILGEFGSGKSTLLTEWCWRRAEQGITPLPVLVDLARAPATASGLDLLLWAVDIEPDSEAADRTRAALVLLTQNQLILPCFDGFDEMATRAGDLHPASRLSALLRVAAGGGRIIITARDHYFSTQSELEQTTSATLRETLGSSSGHRILRVLPLAKGQIAELVQSTLSDAQKSQQALLRIASTYDLTDLVQRPLLLAMVLQSLDRIQPGARVAPADVYEAYVQKWLEQTREDDASLPRDQKVRFAEALAEQLWRSGEPSCTWEALRESVRNRIGQVRLPEHVPDAAAFLDVQGGAFFVREGDDRYRFAHESFREYFLARALVRTLPQHPEEALTTRPLTQEVASFVGELLKREGDPRQALALRGLLPERELSDSGRGQQDSQVFRTNALRLLIGLARWSGELAGWIPEGADLRGLRLWRFDLHGLSLRRVWFTNTDLSGVDLSDADLTGADLSKARLVGARLSGASLDDVRAEGTEFSLVAADRCSLRGANLAGANLTQSVWTHCNWQGAILEGAELTRAGIWGSSADLFSAALARLGISAQNVEVVRGYSFSTVQSLAWSPDGDLLAACHGDGTISVWDAASGRCGATLRGHDSWVLAVGWSPDGSKLLSGSSDRTVRLWDAQSGQPIATLWMKGPTHLVLLPSGFYRSSADAEGELSLALHAARAPRSKFYLPVGAGLLKFLNRPDYVKAALAGNPPTLEQRNAELLAASFAGGTVWDGQPHRVPVKACSLPYEEHRDKDLSLRNPFRPGPAQDDVQRLPGRDEVIAELQSLIGSRSPAVLIGPRRSGKTSILRLLNRQLSTERRVLLLTLEGKQIGSGDDLARLLTTQLGLAEVPASSKKTPRQHLFDELQTIRPQPLFLFDEVVHLQDGDATLFPWLRALGQDLASIVYAGSPLDWVRVVQRAAKMAPGSSFGNDVTPVKLGPIADSDAQRFLVETSQGQISESAARWVIEVCGPWPFYLQVMGHALFESLRLGQRKPLLDRRAFLDLYEQRLLSDRAAPFTGRWEELPAPVRSLLLLPESLLARPVYLDQPQFVRRNLVDAGLCSPQGSWLIDRPFFDWIRANASLLSSEP